MLISINSPAVKLNFLYRFFRLFCQELAHYDRERVSIPKGESNSEVNKLQSETLEQMQ